MRAVLVCAATVWLGGAVALAHHSLAGMYDQGKRVTVDGSIAEFHFVNPHPFLLVDMSDARGRTERWHLEMDNRRELVDIGMKDDTFKVGDRAAASGSPGRSQSRILYVWKLDRPGDGLAYEQIGGSPRIQIPK